MIEPAEAELREVVALGVVDDDVCPHRPVGVLVERLAEIDAHLVQPIHVGLAAHQEPLVGPRRTGVSHRIARRGGGDAGGRAVARTGRKGERSGHGDQGAQYDAQSHDTECPPRILAGSHLHLSPGADMSHCATRDGAMAVNSYFRLFRPCKSSYEVLEGVEFSRRFVAYRSRNRMPGERLELSRPRTGTLGFKPSASDLFRHPGRGEKATAGSVAGLQVYEPELRLGPVPAEVPERLERGLVERRAQREVPVAEVAELLLRLVRVLVRRPGGEGDPAAQPRVRRDEQADRAGDVEGVQLLLRRGGDLGRTRSRRRRARDCAWRAAG